jgi:hypothetical protein
MKTFLDYLLEKDHRGKMVSFGIPEDVAEYLHTFNDKYSIWFANQIKGMEGYQNSKDKVNWIRSNLQTKMTGIVDWVSTVPNIMLKGYDWDKAMAAQEEYHKNIQGASIEGSEENTIIKKYPDGFYWVDLETNRCSEEGGAMGHCARTSADTMYSLRRFYPETQTITPFITIAASPDDGLWQQCKGKKNSKPKPEYHKYIANILVSRGMLKFKSEYDTAKDFTAKDLKEYIQEHPTEFKDAETLISKIDDSMMGVAHFQKVLDDAGEWKYFGIYLEEDYGSEEGAISVSYSCYLSFPANAIKTTDFGAFMHSVEYRDSKHKDFTDTINKAIDAHAEDIEMDIDDRGELTLRIYLQEDDSYFSLDDSGLNSFERNVNYYKRLDSNLDLDELIDKLNEFCVEHDIGEEDKEFGIDPEKVRYYNRNQMDLPLKFESFYKKILKSFLIK